MKKVRSFILSILLIAAACVILILTGGSKVQNYISSKVEDYLSESLSCEAKLKNFKISFPFLAQADSLDLGKENLQWIKAKNITINIKPFSFLLKRKINFFEISIGQIVLSHIPEFPVTQNNVITSHDNIPDFLKNISIKKFNISEFIIKPDVTGLNTDIQFSLKSNIKYSLDILQLHLESNIINHSNKLIENVNISSDIKFDTGNKTFYVEQFKAHSLQYDLYTKGLVNFESKELSGEYNMLFQDLKLVNPKIAGYLGVEGKISGSLENINLASTLVTKDINYVEFQLPDISLNSQIHYNTSKQAGNAEIIEENKKILAKVNFTKQLDMVEINNVELKKDSTMLEGKFDFDLNYHALNGKLKLTSKNFGKFFDIPDLITNGNGEILVDLVSEKECQQLKAELKISDIFFEKLGIIGLKSKLIFNDLWQSKLELFNLNIEDIHYNQELINRNINFQISPIREDFEFVLKSEGKPYNDFELQAAGGVAQDINKKIIIKLANLESKFNKNKLVINKPASLAISSDNFQYDLPELRINNGTLVSNGSLIDKTI
ncbi:MAG: hypothetical protein ACRYE9_00660, partial [Janthinobacterium lividum]